MYMSEVTIGASLPIRTTLNDIMCSGDAVHSIVGIMSVSSGMVSELLLLLSLKLFISINKFL